MDINSMNVEELKELKAQLDQKIKEVEMGKTYRSGIVSVDVVKDQFAGKKVWRLCVDRKLLSRTVRKPCRTMSIVRSYEFEDILPAIVNLISDLGAVKKQIEEDVEQC